VVDDLMWRLREGLPGRDIRLRLLQVCGGLGGGEDVQIRFKLRRLEDMAEGCGWGSSSGVYCAELGLRKCARRSLEVREAFVAAVNISVCRQVDVIVCLVRPFFRFFGASQVLLDFLRRGHESLALAV